MTKCLISGSFDPITNGHYELIARSCKVFDEVHIVLFKNIAKKSAFSEEFRISLIEKLFSGNDKIKISTHSGLLASYVSENKITAVVRGIRNSIDLAYETQMEQVNREIYEDFECIYLSPSAKNSYISSSVVRELLQFGGDIAFAVPPEILQDILSEYHRDK